MDRAFAAQTEYTDRTFKRVEARGQTFEHREFYDCTFVDCAFAESVWQRCRLSNCTFRDCDLSLVKVPDSAFRDVQFERCKVIGVDWTAAAWGPKGGVLNAVRFSACVINYSTFIGLSLHKIAFAGCTAKDVDFAEADLTHADFRRADLTDSRFWQTNLTGADFTGATNYAINASINTLKGTRFSLPEAIALLHSLDIVLTDPDVPSE
jgi:fluoroquinolone resistance protein